MPRENNPRFPIWSALAWVPLLVFLALLVLFALGGRQRVSILACEGPWKTLILLPPGMISRFALVPSLTWVSPLNFSTSASEASVPCRGVPYLGLAAGLLQSRMAPALLEQSLRLAKLFAGTEREYLLGTVPWDSHAGISFQNLFLVLGPTPAPPPGWLPAAAYVPTAYSAAEPPPNPWSRSPVHTYGAVAKRGDTWEFVWLSAEGHAFGSRCERIGKEELRCEPSRPFPSPPAFLEKEWRDSVSSCEERWKRDQWEGGSSDELAASCRIAEIRRRLLACRLPVEGEARTRLEKALRLTTMKHWGPQEHRRLLDCPELGRIPRFAALLEVLEERFRR